MSEEKAHIALKSKPLVKVCSACGSDAPHHVEYVETHGVCVV